MPDNGSELAAIEPPLRRLGAGEGLKGALVSIDAIATNTDVAKAITDQEADYFLAVKGEGRAATGPRRGLNADAAR